MLYKKRCKKDQNEKPMNIKTKRSFQGWELIWCTGFGFAKVMDLLILHIIYKVIIIIIWNQMVFSVSLQSCLYCLSNETVYWKLPGDWWGNDAFRPDTAVVKVSLALGKANNKLYCRVLMFSWPIQIAWPHCVWSLCLCSNNVLLPPPLPNDKSHNFNNRSLSLNVNRCHLEESDETARSIRYDSLIIFRPVFPSDIGT